MYWNWFSKFEGKFKKLTSMKKILSVLFILTIAGFLYSQDTSCIQALYPFNGNAYDETGNGFNGLSFGAVLTKGHDDSASSAYLFDGYDDYIQLNSNEPIIHKPPFSFSVWARKDGTGGGNGNLNIIFSQRDDQTTGAKSILGFQLDKNNSGGIQLTMRGTNMGAVNKLNYNYSPPLYKWHYYAVTVNSNGLAKLYVDTVMVASKNYGQIGRLDSSVNFVYLGKHSYYQVTSGYFNGAIDNFVVHNCALTEQEVKDEYYHMPVDSTSDSMHTGIGYLYHNSHFSINYNPSIHELHVFGISNYSNRNYEVYTITGQLISKGKMSETIQLPQLASGVYIFREVNAENEKRIKKFLVN